MAEQLERFKDLLYRINSGDFKKVTEKYDQITKAIQLFDDEQVKEILCDDEDGYPDVLKHVTNILSFECGENEKKFYSNKKATCYHFKAFELYVSIIKLQCKVLSQNVQFDDLIEGLFICFKNMYLLRSASPPCTASWITALELIGDVFSIYPPIDLEFKRFKNVWELCIEYSKQAFQSGSKTERVKLINIIAHIAPKIHSTFYFTQIKPIISSIAELVNAFAWHQKDPTRMALLNVVNALIENNSERHRDFLLEKFYHLAEELVSGICIIGPNDAKLSSPRKDDRLYGNVNDSDYHGSLYRFIENILILSYPDCEINSLNLKAASQIVEQCYDRFLNEIQDKSRKCLSSGRKFVISKCRLPLLSRVFVLKHSLNTDDSSSLEPRAAKKAKTLSTLSQLVNEGQYCHFQIILELVSSWRHRLRSEDLDELVMDLVKVNRKILKKDDKLELFMRILGTCLIDKRDIPSPDYDELWNWAISLLQIPAIQEAACIAISGIIHYYEEVLSAKPDDLFKVLIFQIAQFSVYSKPVLHLIHLVITRFEFDERDSFRVDIQNSCPEWTFRSQLLYALLKFAPCDENVEDLIMAVLNYHPQEVYCNEEEISSKCNGFEMILAEMYCKTTREMPKNEKIVHTSENTIPLLVKYLINCLSEIWESISEDFGEKQIFLWRICCFSKKTFQLPICSNLLEFFEEQISSNIVSPAYQYILEKMDIGILWEQTNDILRQTINGISGDTESPFCQRYQYFWGDTVSLSKELLDAESIGDSQNINLLISTNCESLSFDDLILIISKFSSVLQPETNEALVKQLMREIEQEVQLGGNSDLAECLHQRFLFSICRYIDLNSILFSDNLKRFLLVNPNVVAELSSKFPLTYFTEHDYEEIIPHLTSLQFCRLFLAALENMKNEYIPLPMLKGLLTQSYVFLAEFVPDFDKYISFWKPLLAFYRNSVTNVNPEWDLQIPHYSNNLLHLRLIGKSSVVDYTYSPAIFTLPITVIERLLDDFAFKDNWLNWEDKSFIHRTLRNLRCFIFNLRNSGPSKLNYPLIFIRTILYFLKNGFTYGELTDDITSIITALFFDAVKFCSDKTLSSLALDFVNVVDSAKLPPLRVVLIVDILFEHYEKFRQTIEDLKENCKNCAEDSGLNCVREYIPYKEMIMFPERNLSVIVPSYIEVEVYDLIENKKFDPDLPGYHFQLMGFWEALYKELETKPDINVLNCVIPFWMFFPRLRPSLTKVIVLFPSNQIDSILRDYRFFMKALSEHSDFRTFIPEFVLVIAFDPTVIYEESITKAIYDVLCASIMQKSQPLSQYVEPEEEEDILPSNYAGLILKNLADCIPSKPWMLKFLSMAYKIPLCANLSLIRFLKTSNEQSCHRLIELLNSTFSSLLMEDNEKLKSRHPSTTTQYSTTSSFPLNISQMNQTINGSSDASLSTKACSVFESENAIMFLFAAVNLTEMLYKYIHLFDLKLFSTCLLRAKMFKEAYFFLKLLIDSTPIENRDCFAFKKLGSLVNIIEDEELKVLITDALIGLKDYKSLSQMPLNLRTKSNARALIAECKHDWGAMASICNTVEEKDTQAKALLALGSLPSGCSKEVKYEAVVQLSSWNDPGSAVSFPKKATSHWEQLYSVIKKHKDGRNLKELNFLSSSLEAVASKTIIDPFQLTCCRHLFLLQNLVQNRSCFIPDGVLRCSFHLANISRDDSSNNDEETFENAVTAVVDQSKNLRKKGALLLSLKLLDAFDTTTKKSFAKVKPKNSTLSSLSLEIAIERAKTLVANNDSDMAAFLLTELTETKKKTASERIAKNVSRAYKLLGKLQPENCLNHLSAACDVTSKNDFYHKNLLKLAMFYENDYQTTQDYMESSAFKLKQEFVDDCSSSPVDDKATKKLSREEQLQHHVLKMEKNVEENEIKIVKERRIKTLTNCIENYLKAVIYGSTDKTIPYRIVALMIQNTEETHLMKLIKNNLNKFPTNVWLPVLNVLSSHLFSDKLPICDVVEEISIRTIGDYPYIATRHFLFYLSDTSTNVHGTSPRNAKVKKLFEQCQKRSPPSAKIIQNLIKADKCFIEVGVSEFQNSSFYLYLSNNKYEMTNEIKVMKHIEFMKMIPIPTVSQPIFPPGSERNYDIKEFITIANIDKKCFEAGGLSKPKVLTFYGSNEKKYKLIFKGEDLRQDSLVQQLFSVQNLIMEQNQRSSSTFSPLRTYAVIPLSPQCGIIEWCEGTVSLCSYLIGEKKDAGAHAQYRPTDILASKGQQIMKSRQNGYNTTEVFLDICKSIQPVFRHFFYSKFNNSKDFHEAIDRYTQSLAQWSIVCYVVGLGDRHLNNILIDEKRGELVHIDLGQIFEFSKRSLPIPERIPFRLTRDLVDPLLIDGVYGHLKDIAVHTMKQMRENARVIVGIASSLVHDPVSTFAAVSSQTNNRHFVAEAAISRLKEKLAGRDSSLFVLTPEQQVCNLIQDATNPENLSKVFVGWMPFI